MAVKKYLITPDGKILYPYTIAESVFVNNEESILDVMDREFVRNKVVIGVLTSGSTSLILKSEYFVQGCTVDIYTDTFGIAPTDVEVNNGYITLTFEELSRDLNVKVMIK